MDKFYEIDQKWLDDNSDVVSDALERNWNIAIGDIPESNYISFEYNGMDISNPLADESARLSLSLKESVERYGADNVHTFLQRLKEEEINPRVITIFSDDPELLKELKQTYGKNVVIDDNFEHLSAMQDEIFLTKSSYAILAYNGEEQKERLSEYAQNVNDTYDVSADSDRLNKIMEYIEVYNSLVSDIRDGNAAIKFESWFFSGGRGEDTAFYDIIDTKTNEKAGFIGFVSYNEIEAEYKGYRFTNYTRVHSTFEGQQKQLWETVNEALKRDDPLFYNVKVGSYEDFTRDEFIQAVKDNNEYIIGEGFPRDEFLAELKKAERTKTKDMERG